METQNREKNRELTRLRQQLSLLQIRLDALKEPAIGTLVHIFNIQKRQEERMKRAGSRLWQAADLVTENLDKLILEEKNLDWLQKHVTRQEQWKKLQAEIAALKTTLRGTELSPGLWTRKEQHLDELAKQGRLLTQTSKKIEQATKTPEEDESYRLLKVQIEELNETIERIEQELEETTAE